MTDFIRDPDGSLSSARLGALALVFTACGVAIAGMWLNREQPATVAALLGGSGLAFYTRTKTTQPDPS